MKKILVIVAALVVAGACAAPHTNREARPAANPNSNADTVVVMTDAEAIAKEKAAWEAIKNKDYDAFAKMLTDDAIEVLPGNVNDKTRMVANARDFEPGEITFADWKVLRSDQGAVVVTYTVSYKGKYQGQEFPTLSARSSSAWVKRDGKWMSIYHQECAIKSPPPSPSLPRAKAGAIASTASPTTSPLTLATGPDPIPNEKLLWDLFKNKNFDGFASLLRDDAIEVEPDGVYDKAGIVKLAAEFDASQAMLSDWKVVKLDDSASLVTYLVTIPGLAKDGERHTTIWTMRAGKWLSLFHHGTPVVPEQAISAAKGLASCSISVAESIAFASLTNTFVWNRTHSLSQQIQELDP
jgi:hypothetical protein